MKYENHVDEENHTHTHTHTDHTKTGSLINIIERPKELHATSTCLSRSFVRLENVFVDEQTTIEFDFESIRLIGLLHFNHICGGYAWYLIESGQIIESRWLWLKWLCVRVWFSSSLQIPKIKTFVQTHSLVYWFFCSLDAYCDFKFVYVCVCIFFSFFSFFDFCNFVCWN